MSASETCQYLMTVFLGMSLFGIGIQVLLRRLISKYDRNTNRRMAVVSGVQLGFCAVAVTGVLALISQATHMNSPGFHGPTALLATLVCGFAGIFPVSKVLFVQGEAQKVVNTAEDITRSSGEDGR